MNKFIIITSIHTPSKGVIEFSNKHGWELVVVGDRKTPEHKNPGYTFLDLKTQKDMGFSYANQCPENHYCRKAIGYLFAIQQGADIIYETDDDNIPYENWGVQEFESMQAINSESGFANVYKYFTDDFIWPRGYPIDRIRDDQNAFSIEESSHTIAAWQGLADGDPDVDAIYRLTIQENPILFKKREAIALNQGVYCPFNSQNTAWSKRFFPLMYLPCTVSFRYTDILRGYVAQRIFWHFGHSLGFHNATVLQERNAHDLIADLESEAHCYYDTYRLVECLNSIEFGETIGGALVASYKALIRESLVPENEMDYLNTWIRDLQKFEV